jgi:hypothetical protein
MLDLDEALGFENADGVVDPSPGNFRDLAQLLRSPRRQAGQPDETLRLVFFQPELLKYLNCFL